MTDDETRLRSRYKLRILPKRPLWLRRVVLAVNLTAATLVLLLGTSLGVLLALATGTVSPSARTSGNDALWLGHAWVDGRRDQADVDALAARLRGTGIRRQTQLVLDAVPPNVDVLIGLPAYHTDDFGHFGNAETVAAAIRGVRLALGSHPARRTFGVALYVDFTATELDWKSYRETGVDNGP